MTDQPSPRAVAWALVVAEVIGILIGVGLLAIGWTLMGETFIVLGVLGLIYSLAQAWRTRKTGIPPTP
jgi:hypothetical protein